MLKKIRGTQDLLDLRLQNFILDEAKKHMQVYNFNQIETPIIESTDLFIHSLGETTDVVSKEMFIIKRDEGKTGICLRPEATASTMRAYLENNVTSKPWKVFSYGPMFRHERPQKGRWRQFSQFNIEVINSNSILQDAHFIKMLDSFFYEKLKLENYVLKINFIGSKEDRVLHREKLSKYLDSVSENLCDDCKIRIEKNMLRVFDCKNQTCQSLLVDAPKIIDNLSEETSLEWESLCDVLDFLSVSYVVDPKLVRGLDYYNKTVFEFVSKELGAQSAFCGGGRYSLGKELGAKEEFPSIGAAIGLGRLLMLVEKNQEKLAIPQDQILHIILPIGKEQEHLALLLSSELQSNNLCTDVLIEKASMTNKMKKANKMGAKFVLIIGDDEQKNGTVSVKNMQSGERKIIKQSEVVGFLK